jgi:hypothetical protein
MNQNCKSISIALALQEHGGEQIFTDMVMLVSSLVMQTSLEEAVYDMNTQLAKMPSAITVVAICVGKEFDEIKRFVLAEPGFSNKMRMKFLNTLRESLYKQLSTYFDGFTEGVAYKIKI